MMRDSKLPADWLARMVAANPWTKLPDGSFRTCPVRLAFVHLMKPDTSGKNDDGTDKTPTYHCAVLLPPGGQEQMNAVVWPDVYAMMRAEFPSNIGPDGNPFALHSPMGRDQGEKQQYSGYTPGLPFLGVSSQFKPQIVDPAMNPIVSEDRVYPGVWALLSLNLYSFGKQKGSKKKGISFGLQSVMLIADDTKLSGGAPDPKTQFGGVNIDAKFDPASAFGTAPALGAPPAPPGAFMPPPMPVGPGAPPPSFAPPPGFGGGFAPPPAPAASAFDLSKMLGG